MSPVQPTQHETDVLARAWPAGVDPEDEKLLRSLPAARREKVVARLEALCAIEEARRDNPRAHVDLKEIARRAGLTTDGLFAIRRKWAASRRLESVVPYLGRSERQPTQRDEDDPVVVATRAMILERAGDADSVIASELRRMFGLSVPVLIRLVRRLRRDDATDSERVLQVFGRSLLIDVCAIDRATFDGAAIAVAMVAERASGLILGHAVEAVGPDTLKAQAAAARAATALLAQAELDVSGGRAEVELTLGDGPLFEQAFAMAERLKAGGLDLRVNSRGPRRYGQRLVTLLGKRLGRISFRPRASAPGSPVGFDDRMSVHDARILVADDVAAHNDDVLARLAEGGVAPGWGVSSGSMAAALDTALAVLDPR